MTAENDAAPSAKGVPPPPDASPREAVTPPGESVPPPPGAPPPPPPPGAPPRETEKEKLAERPHRITILFARITILFSALALFISIVSAILQEVNTVRARKEAAQAAEKQEANVERSRIAAENSAESAGVLAEATLRALELQSRSTTAVEKNAEASKSFAKDERIIRDILARSQSARLMVRLEPYKDAKSGADSRRLLLVNGTLIPALGVEVGYEIHTLGMPDQSDLAWRLTPNEPQPVSESVNFYVKAIEKLKSQYSISFLAPGTGVTVADTLPAPKWFFLEFVGGLKDYSSVPVPQKYAALRSAVVFGYVRYADNANKSKKVPFCFPLDPKKRDLNCEKVNSIE